MMLEKVRRGKQPPKPRRVLMYGVHGIGKTTWAAKWPKPIIVPTEDGAGDVECDSLPVCQNVTDAWLAVQELAGIAEHDYETIVIDSADWLERLIWRDLCDKHKKESIADFGYGKGYVDAARQFERFLVKLDEARNSTSRPCHIVFLAHSAITRYEAPDGSSYDRFTPKLHRETSGLLQEWADEVLFAQYEVLTKQADEGFGRKRTVPLSSARRIVRTQEGPAYLAKNRLGLPEVMGLDFEELRPFITTTKKEN